jgi:dTDP-4-dehydrorhamnose 3,5-epimerase
MTAVSLTVTRTAIPDVLEIEPRLFEDDRGHFYEAFNEREFREATGVTLPFVQDNHSLSWRHVLRGLHFQLERPQGKLVRVTHGEIFDVAVDLRRSSPTFGRWVGSTLTGENRRQVWVPPGFAHGFVVLSEHASVQYKVTDFRHAAGERAIRWDDPQIGIDWPAGIVPRMAAKDTEAGSLADAELFD